MSEAEPAFLPALITVTKRAGLLLVAISLVLPSISVAEEAGRSAATESDTISYHRQILPIFRTHCQGCHQRAKASGEYVMTAFASLIQGGESGNTAIVPKNPDESYLLDQILPSEGEADMPKGESPLSESDIELVRLWISQGAHDDSPPSGQPLIDADHPPQYQRRPVVTSLDISDDGTLVAVAGYHEVLLHATEDSKWADANLVGRLVGLAERIESVRFSPDGTRLAVTGGLPAQSGEVQVWDLEKRSLLLSQSITFDSVYGGSWSPDGGLIAVGCADTSVRAIDAQTGKQVLFQGAHNDWVLDTAFSIEGDHVVSVGADMTAKLTELSTQRFVDNVTSITPGALKGGIQAVVRHPHRNEVLFGGADGVPKIYQMHRTTKRQIGDDANLLWELPSLPGRIFDVDINGDGSRIVVGSSLNGVGHVHIYGMKSETVTPPSIKNILKKPTHSRTDTETDKLRRYFQAGVETIAKLRINTGGIYAVAISFGGETIATGGGDGLVRVIDGATGNLLRKFSPVTLAQPAERDREAKVARNGSTKSSQELSIPTANIETSTIVALELAPSEITLNSPRAYAQSIVTARLRSGATVDVTRNVKWTSSANVVRVSPTGMITPRTAGHATLNVSVGDQTADLSVFVAGLDSTKTPDYIQDVNPILARVGCNSGTCHGSQDGKNGFKLSLRGYDPIFDVRALTDDLAARRVNVASPESSLILAKPSAHVPHEGGQVVAPDSDYYQMLHAWISGGATLDMDVARVVGIEAFPKNPVVEQIENHQQVRVEATYSDGSRRDVTREAFIESGNTDIVSVDGKHPGLLQALRRGEAAVLVRYEGNYSATTITVMGDRTGFVWVEPEKNNKIDDFVATKLRRTKTLPSPRCSDYEFLRRVHLDLTGIPPTIETVRTFINDPLDSKEKRDALIDQLIGNPEFVEHWTNKWADLLQVNSKFLGRDGAVALRQWIRTKVDTNTPYDQFTREVLTASGSTIDEPEAAYFKILRTPQDTMENTTQLFLATRFNCNKCHDHPFERWTQDQYYELAAYFAQVGRKADPRIGDKQIGKTTVEEGKPFYEVVYDRNEGEIEHDRTGEVTAPKFPFDCEHEPISGTRRERLAAWMTSADNPYFAMSYVNRLWGYLTGRGIIEPIDDIRAGNPPTNPDLLHYLTQEFVDHGFDARHVLRLICRSRTYQASVETNQWNEDDHINYSHAIPRRLIAESLYDAIHMATGAKTKFPDVDQGTRAAALPDVGIKLPDGFLGNFGRPARESACECERTSEMQLGPVIALINGPTVGDAIGDPENAIADLANQLQDDRELIKELYLRILNRPANQEELSSTAELFGEITRDHQTLLTKLHKHEQKTKPLLEQRQRDHQAQLNQAKQHLAEYEEEAENRRAVLESKQKEEIAALQQQLEIQRQKVINQLPKWEKEHSQGSRWTVLEPLEMVSSNDSPMEVEADMRIYAPARGQDTIYDIVARLPVSQVSGIRLEALTDKRLRGGGPGHNFDGNYYLTEFEADYAPSEGTQALRLHSWDFATGSDGWHALVDCEFDHQDGVLTVNSKSSTPSMVTDIHVPAGKMAFELVAEVDKYATVELLWKTASTPDFDHDRKSELRIVKNGGSFRRHLVYFETDEPVTGLRFDSGKRETKMRIDSMALLRLEQPQFNSIKIVDAQADFSEEGYDVSTSIDGLTPNSGNGWGIAPRMNENHVAVFRSQRPFGKANDLLRVRMKHFHVTKEHQVAMFRLSVTDDSRPPTFGMPKTIGNIVDIPADKRTDEQKNELNAYVTGLNRDLQKLVRQVENAKKPIPEEKQHVELKAQVARLEKPLPPDFVLARLRSAAKLSEKQLDSRRLTVAQDLAWALINSPAFLYNH